MIVLSVISSIFGIVIAATLYSTVKEFKKARQQVVELTVIYAECKEENTNLKSELEELKVELEKAKTTKTAKTSKKTKTK